jgi:hypothetical protein
VKHFWSCAAALCLSSSALLVFAEITTAGDLMGANKDQILAELREQGMTINGAKETFIRRVVDMANPAKKPKKGTPQNCVLLFCCCAFSPACRHSNRNPSRGLRGFLFQPSKGVLRKEHPCHSSSGSREAEANAADGHGGCAQDAQSYRGHPQALARQRADDQAGGPYEG